MDGNKPVLDITSILGECCSRYGYCLPPKEIVYLVQNPPGTKEELVQEIITREGFPIESVARSQWNQIQEVVEKWCLAHSRKLWEWSAINEWDGQGQPPESPNFS